MTRDRGEVVEHQMRAAAYEIGEYFSNLIIEKRKQNKVAVLIDGEISQLFFMPCNEQGLPNQRYFERLEIPRLSLQTFKENDSPDLFSQEITITKQSIEIYHPLVSFNYYDVPYWEIGNRYICMWAGRFVFGEKIPVENLDVKYLMKLAQTAIKTREGIILDEAIKNKLIH